MSSLRCNVCGKVVLGEEELGPLGPLVDFYSCVSAVCGPCSLRENSGAQHQMDQGEDYQKVLASYLNTRG